MSRRPGTGRGPDALGRCHPLVAFALFGLALTGTVLFLHPVVTGLSLAGALGCSLYLLGGRAARFALLGMAPLFVVAAAFNPLFSHAGATILGHLPDGNPLTLESIVYGLFAAAMIVAVVIWFTAVNRVLTADKLHYLFGRLAPALALVFAMSLRFVPRLKAQVRRIAFAQRGLGGVGRGSGLGAGRRGPFRRAMDGLAVISALVTWALENSVELADSMRARGFGTGRRTSFHLFRADSRDRLALAVLAAAVLAAVPAVAGRGLSMRFFPALDLPPAGPAAVAAWAGWAAVAAMPLALNGWEEAKWRRIALTG